MRLGELVVSLLRVFRPRMRNKGIRLSQEMHDDVEICAVPGEIRHVIANLRRFSNFYRVAKILQGGVF